MNQDGDFILAHGENYQQCPYNLAHVITNARLIVHLDKCRRNYLKMMKEAGKKADMKQCKFNYLHHVPAPEIDFHESRCPDQYNVVETLRYHQSEEFHELVEEEKRAEASRASSSSHSHKDKKHSKKRRDMKPDPSPWGEDAEDWEAESNGYEPGYDPSGKLDAEIVLYHPRGLSKSERKTHRKDLRQRAADQANVGMHSDEVDVKPFAKLEVKSEPKVKVEAGSYSGPSKAPPPTRQPPAKPEPIDLEPDEIEEGECSEEEFYGEDPYST